MLLKHALSANKYIRPACSVTTEFMIKTLGLDICADTVIGNAMKRGVSGGQKKRVTTGEIHHRALLLPRVLGMCCCAAICPQKGSYVCQGATFLDTWLMQE